MDNKQQELIFKLGMFEQQIRQLQQQIQAVEQGITEMSLLHNGLGDLVGGEGKEILAPIGRGIFVKSKVLSEKLSVDVGGGNVVQKTIPETQEIISRQIKKLEEVREDLENSLEKLGEEMTRIMEEGKKENN
jgi:prefoldin alpha subunit